MEIRHITNTPLPVWLAMPASAPVGFHLHLHGSGDRGCDFGELSRWGLSRLIAEGMALPFAVVVPVCPTHGDWAEPRMFTAAEQCLAVLMEEAGQRGSAASISGYSMGARGIWSNLRQRSGLYDRALLIAGRVPSPIPEPADANLSLRVFHGSEDDHEAVARVRGFCEAAAAKGWNIRFTEMPDRGHFIADEVFRRDDVQQWLAGAP